MRSCDGTVNDGSHLRWFKPHATAGKTALDVLTTTLSRFYANSSEAYASSFLEDLTTFWFSVLQIRTQIVKRMEAREVGSTGIEDEGLDTDAGRASSFKEGAPAVLPTESNSFKERDYESSSVGSDSIRERDLDAAAVTVQKVYKSYRTRRNLADCAVVAEELWWRAIDFATLKQSTVSFFHIDKPESAGHRWWRAGLNAAKVGKGLSKDDSARKLAFQHWIEAIDPRHRYGHNLHFYYNAWIASDTQQPFFYWLDVGDGRDLNLKDDCPRVKLQQQRIKYLGPKERERYEIVPKDGKLVHKQTGQLVDTTKGSDGSKWIFVMSTSKQIYAGQKQKGTFQHSSFLAGGATSAAGRFTVEDGILKSVWAYSGHYHPTEQNLNEVLSYLEENGIDITNVQKGSYDEDEHNGDPEKDYMTESKHNSQAERKECLSFEKLEGNVVQEAHIDSEASNGEMKNGTALCPDQEQNRTDDAPGIILPPCQLVDLNQKTQNGNDGHLGLVMRTRSEGSEMMGTTDEQDNQEQVFYKRSLSDDLENKTEIPESSLLKRINSKKAIKSYQLGNRLSLKWSTGAGPRIGCVADYPAELRFMALEKVNLSPRCITPCSYQSPRCKSPTICEPPQCESRCT